MPRAWLHVRPDGGPSTDPLWLVEREGADAPELRGASWAEAVAYARERSALGDGDFIVRGDEGQTP